MIGNNGEGCKSWGTNDEMNFIDNLGNIQFKQLWGMTKKDLLSWYIRGLKHRKEWGNIDEKRVINYAESMIGVLK